MPGMEEERDTTEALERTMEEERDTTETLEQVSPQSSRMEE